MRSGPRLGPVPPGRGAERASAARSGGGPGRARGWPTISTPAFRPRERRYLFRLVARRAPVTHDRGLVWQVPNPLDLAAMRQAAAHLIGQHDFTTFRSTLCQADKPGEDAGRDRHRPNTPYPGGSRDTALTLRARSFLHNQVRSIVGTLERVGAGRLAARPGGRGAGRPRPRRLRPGLPRRRGCIWWGWAMTLDPFCG